MGEENSSSQVGSSSTGDGWLDFSVCDYESLEQSFADPAKMYWFRVVDNSYVYTSSEFDYPFIVCLNPFKVKYKLYMYVPVPNTFLTP